MAHSTSIPAVKVVELLGKRAEVLRANRQPMAAFMDLLTAAQVSFCSGFKAYIQ